MNQKEDIDIKKDKGAEYTRRIILFWVTAVVIIGIYQIPGYGFYILYPLTLLYTFVHEMGHGITALMVGGVFHKFQMWADASGVAMCSAQAGYRAALVSAGGLLAPPIMAFFLFLFARTPKSSRIGLIICAILNVLSLILFVRNVFGFIFVSLISVISVVAAKFFSDKASQWLLILVAISLSVSVFSRGDYLFEQYAQTASGRLPSDVENISLNLILPYWFWGGIIAVFSVLILVAGSYLYFKRNKERDSHPIS